MKTDTTPKNPQEASSESPSTSCSAFIFKGKITDKVRIDFLDWLANRKSAEYKNAVRTTYDNLETDIHAYSHRVSIYARGTAHGVKPHGDISETGKNWRNAIDRMISRYPPNA
jgi:hypothetical protein